MSLRNVVAAAINRNKGLCVAISSFTCSFILWGFGYTFTLLFVYIQEDFDSSTTATGWVGSVYFGLGSTLGIVINPLVKHFKYSTIFVSGMLLAGLSLLVSSFVQSIHTFFITYGVFYATGTCIGYFSSMDLVKMYYADSPYRTRATFFSTMGSSVGFLVQSPLVGKMLTAVGWRGVLRIYAGITIIVGLICSIFLQRPAGVRDAGEEEDSTLETKDAFLKHEDAFLKHEDAFLKHEDKHDKRDKVQEKVNRSCWQILAFPESWYFVIGMVITSTATMFCYVYVVDFMNYIGISTYVSSWILVAAGGSELAGKIFFAVFGDRMRFPKMYIMAPTNVLFAVFMVILIYARTSLHMIVLVLFIGALKSIFHAMPWTATIELLGTSRNTESTILTCLGFGIGSLSGTLVGGLSYDYTGSYDVCLLVSCGMYIVGALFFQAAPLHQKLFAPERYLTDGSVTSISEKHYDYIVDSYITTV